MSFRDFKKRLDPEIQKKIGQLNEQDEASFYEEAKRMTEERLNRLLELEREG